VCEVLTRHDVVPITAAISPIVRSRLKCAARSALRRGLVKCPINVLRERDVKGLYKKALAGEIKNFTASPTV
jgi:adenylylsulfate kinase-like enzyme